MYRTRRQTCQMVSHFKIIYHHDIFICFYGPNGPTFSAKGNIKGFTAIVSGGFNKKHLCTFESCTCATINTVITGPSKGANTPSCHGAYAQTSAALSV